MAKYRLLTDAELKSLESEFVDYLVVNGITADEWQRLKIDENEKAQQITDLFSDVVMEGALRKINFLDLYTSETLQGIQCLEDRMLMVAVKSEDKDFDLLNKTQFTLEDIQSGKVTVYKGQKKYEGSREEAIFEMTQKGYEVSEGELFKELALLAVED